MIVLPLKVHKRVVSRFKQEAKKLFPFECFGYILGLEASGFIELTDLWIPEDIRKHVTTSQVKPQDTWIPQVLEYCEEHDLVAIGSIHSHPYRYEDLTIAGGKAVMPDHAPSEDDALHGLTHRIHGICRITESKNKRLTATIRFWGPALKVETSFI